MINASMAMTIEHVEVFNVVDIVRQGVGAIIMDSTPLVVYVKTIHRSIITHGVEAGREALRGR
jgi:hypothetical protein